jgi:hypothetical protein
MKSFRILCLIIFPTLLYPQDRKPVIGQPRFQPTDPSLGYKNVQEARQAIASAHVTAFGVDNLLKDGISKDGVNNWYAMLRGIERFVEQFLKKDTNISAANRELISEVVFGKTGRPVLVRKASDEFINSIKLMRTISHNFQPNKYDQITLEHWNHDKAIIEKLRAVEKELAQWHAKLQPVTGTFLGAKDDYKNTKEVKEMLRFLIQYLRASYEKLFREFDAIKGPIRVAIDRKVAQAHQSLAPSN